MLPAEAHACVRRKNLCRVEVFTACERARERAMPTCARASPQALHTLKHTRTHYARENQLMCTIELSKGRSLVQECSRSLTRLPLCRIVGDAAKESALE